MALAKDRLQHGVEPLETTAAVMGNESASAFSTAFRKRFGIPPEAFAREARA